MYVIEELNLNDFKEVNIPQRKLMFLRFAGRPVSDFNRNPSDLDLPDNLGGSPMEDYRAGRAIEDYERYKEQLSKEVEKLEVTDSQSVKNDENE